MSAEQPQPETYGELRTPDGKTKKLVAIFTVFRDEREVTVAQTEDGSLVISTKSWLRDNNRELVHTVHHYTLETFAMMAETMLLGAEYFGIDMAAEAKRLHASDGKCRIEFAGRGEPNFTKHEAPST